MSSLVGRTLTHYRILRQLGAGGMGDVYEAEDTKLGRRVALKVLPTDMARDPQRRERFEREAKAVATLNHPNIVTIYSIEEADDLSFITMELIEGQTLRHVLPRGGLPLRKILDLAIPLSEAVAAAHQQGITHRDLKPENILVGRDGKIKILDFGLAKVGEVFGSIGDGSRLPTRALTEEGRIVGTVAYMSPEQAEGKTVDPRSDVFTLGIILYEMSTGERPFKGDTAVSLLSSILKDNPLPVSQINATLPRDLARIVNRCLMKEPVRRFQSALGLATELATLKQESDSGELTAVGPKTRRSGAQVSSARMVAYAAAAVAVVAVIVGGALALRDRASRTGTIEAPVAAMTPTGGASPMDGRQKIVVLPFENLGSAEDSYFAAGMTEEITSRLVSLSGLGVISRTSAVQYARTGKTTREIGKELGVDYVLEGTVRWERGGPRSSRVRVTPQLIRVSDDTQLWGDRYDREMKDIFNVQSEIAEQVVQKLGVAMQRPDQRSIPAQPTQNMEAYQVYLRGKNALESAKGSKITAEQAVTLLEEAVRRDPGFAVAWAALSKAHSSMYQFRHDYTEDRLGKARECADKALALQPSLREGHLALGYYYYWGRRDYVQALQEFALATGGRTNDSETIEAISYIERRQGRWEEALAGMEKAFALNPRNAGLANSIGETYDLMRRFPEALRYADIAIALAPDITSLNIGKFFTQLKMDGNTRAARESLAKVDPRENSDALWLRIYPEMIDGNYAKALEALAKAPGEILEGQSFYSPRPLQAGLIYLAMKDRAKAAAACKSAIPVLDKAVKRDPRDARVRMSLSQVFACLGRKDEAIQEARLAVDLTPVTSDALDGSDSLLNQAQVYAQMGETDAAIDILDKLLSMPSAASVNLLKIDPVWEPLRKLPRFRNLTEKYK